MQFNREQDLFQHTIHAIGADSVTVVLPISQAESPEKRLKTVTDSVVILPQRLVTDWPAKGPEALKLEDFLGILEQKPELILLGTGGRQRFPPFELMGELARRGCPLEVMDNAAAGRTYNILIYEGRQVALALLMD